MGIRKGKQKPQKLSKSRKISKNSSKNKKNKNVGKPKTKKIEAKEGGDSDRRTGENEGCLLQRGN